MRQKDSKFYCRWNNMKLRCFHRKCKDFKNYGGRGISICKKWMSFRVFEEWCIRTYKEGMMLDRRDNNKGYSPSNCRWVDRHTQNINQRKNTPAILKHCIKLKKLHALSLIRKYGHPSKRTKKYCAMCLTFVSLDIFSRNGAAHDGFGSYCRKCDAKRRRI